jgi:hypothetical protein
VTVTKGEEHIGVYHKTPRSYRKFCKICGGHLMTSHPQWDLVDVYAATIRRIPPSRSCTCTTRNRPPHEGRLAEDEGPAEGDGRIGRALA